MGRTGYDTTNFRNSGPDPHNLPPRKAGMGLIVPHPSLSQDPKGEGKERADTPSDSAVEVHRAHSTHLPPVRRSADYREAVIEPFPVLPQGQRQARGFGLQVGPRGYGAGVGNRPRAMEIQTTGGKNNPLDVEMGNTSLSVGPFSTGTGTGFGDDADLKTPRASQFVLPSNFSRGASRSSQQPQHFDSSPSRHQVHGQHPDGLPPPPPPHILRSQATQFGLTTNKSSGDGNGNHHTQSQGLRSQPFNSNNSSSISSRRNAFASDTAELPQFARSDTMTAHRYQDYDFIPSSSSFETSDARGLYLRTVTPYPDSVSMGLGSFSENRGYSQGSMTAAGSVPRAAATPRTTAIMGSTVRPLSGFNTRAGTGFESGLRLVDRSFPFFPQPTTQAEKDRRRKAALDDRFAQLSAKRQKRNH